MTRMYDLGRNKKMLSLTIFTILTVCWSDVSLQWPKSANTTIADHGRRRWKWPPSAPHEALCSASMRWMDGWWPPGQADIIFEAVEGVYGPQNTPMLWQFIIARTKERFEGHTHPQPPQKIHPQAQGAVIYPLEASAQGARPHVGH
jgi:hypothetical protein